MNSTIDALATRLVSKINARIASELKKQPKSWAGYIIPNSWDPKDGSVAVRVKHTAFASVDQDGTTRPIDPIRVPLMTGALGHQYGPQGYEDVTLLPRADRYVAIFEHNQDTTPQAPAGEHWLVHYTATAVVDLWLKLTNALGIDILAGPLFHVHTKNGVVFDMNDSTGVTQVGSTGLDADLDAVVTVRYLRQYVDTVYNAHVHPGVQSGGSSTATPTGTMHSDGSQTVRAKP